jgi:hypothetical protein
VHLQLRSKSLLAYDPNHCRVQAYHYELLETHAAFHTTGCRDQGRCMPSSSFSKVQLLLQLSAVPCSGRQGMFDMLLQKQLMAVPAEQRTAARAVAVPLVRAMLQQRYMQWRGYLYDTAQ